MEKLTLIRRMAVLGFMVGLSRSGSWTQNAPISEEMLFAGSLNDALLERSNTPAWRPPGSCLSWTQNTMFVWRNVARPAVIGRRPG
jgi:hypothetical protein